MVSLALARLSHMQGFGYNAHPSSAWPVIDHSPGESKRVSVNEQMLFKSLGAIVPLAKHIIWPLQIQGAEKDLHFLVGGTLKSYINMKIQGRDIFVASVTIHYT